MFVERRRTIIHQQFWSVSFCQWHGRWEFYWPLTALEQLSCKFLPLIIKTWFNRAAWWLLDWKKDAVTWESVIVLICNGIANKYDYNWVLWHPTLLCLFGNKSKSKFMGLFSLYFPVYFVWILLDFWRI